MQRTTKNYTILSLFAAALVSILAYQNCGQNFQLAQQATDLSSVNGSQNELMPLTEDEINYLRGLQEANERSHEDALNVQNKPCVFSSFSETPQGFKGYSVDLCDGADKPRPGAAALYTYPRAALTTPDYSQVPASAQTRRGFHIKEDGYEVYFWTETNDLMAIVLPTRQVTVEINGKSYSGVYGIDFEPLPSKYFHGVAVHHIVGLGFEYQTPGNHNAGQFFRPYRVFEKELRASDIEVQRESEKVLALRWKQTPRSHHFLFEHKFNSGSYTPILVDRENLIRTFDRFTIQNFGRHCFRMRVTDIFDNLSKYSKETCLDVPNSMQQNPQLMAPANLKIIPDPSGTLSYQLTWNGRGAYEGTALYSRTKSQNDWKLLRKERSLRPPFQTSGSRCYIVRHYMGNSYSGASNEVCYDVAADSRPLIRTATATKTTNTFKLGEKIYVRIENVPSNHDIRICTAGYGDTKCESDPKTSSNWERLSSGWTYNSSQGRWEHSPIESTDLGIGYYVMHAYNATTNKKSSIYAAVYLPDPLLIFSGAPGGARQFYYNKGDPAPARAEYVPANHKLLGCHQTDATPPLKRCLNVNPTTSEEWVVIEGPWKYNSQRGYWEHPTFKADLEEGVTHQFYVYDVTRGKFSRKASIHVRR